MARYSFTGRTGYFGGTGLSGGMGAALIGAINSGSQMAHNLYDLQNRVMTDPYRVPAANAMYNAQREQAINDSMWSHLRTSALANLLTGQQRQQAEAQANPGGSYFSTALGLDNYQNLLNQASFVESQKAATQASMDQTELQNQMLARVFPGAIQAPQQSPFAQQLRLGVY